MSGNKSSTLAPMVDKLVRRSPLSQVEIEAVLALPHRLKTSDAHAHLGRQGEQVGSCMVLLSGFAYRSKVAGDGARQILSLHLKGDLLDLQTSLLGDADHGTQALTRVEVAYIPHQAILNVAEAYPAVARALWRDTLVDASIFREWILNVGQRNARKRISHLLCELALRQEEAGICDGPQYAWPMTQEQIGDATGLTSVHVNRTIQSMRADGIIATTKQRVTITDWARLETEGDFSRAYLYQTPERRPSQSLRQA